MENNRSCNKIKVLMHYDTNKNSIENRAYHLAACTKIDYIFETIMKLGKKISILSASGTLNPKKVKGHTEILPDGKELILLPSLGHGGKIKNLIRFLHFKIVLFLKLLFYIKKNDILLVYHSLGYMRMISFLKKIKKFHLILEVEEIYGDVKENSRIKKSELQFAQLADSYIFPSELLDKIVNTSHKPSVIGYGTYHVTEETTKFNDGKIHVLYAGTLDQRMGSGLLVEAAKFLPENYHIHILGGRQKEEIDYIKNKIEETKATVKCELTYDGVKENDEYTDFVSKCDIGVCPHYPDARFNNTSFPSKILSYMSCGLRVVSVRIPTVEMSEIGKYMYYYENQTPESIADCITSVNLDDSYEGREVVRNLDLKFTKNLSEMISTL